MEHVALITERGVDLLERCVSAVPSLALFVLRDRWPVVQLLSKQPVNRPQLVLQKLLLGSVKHERLRCGGLL